jgi:hypothetical protein
MTIRATHNSTYKKLAVQWLNEALCIVSSSVLADNLVLRNHQLLVAAKRYAAVFIIKLLQTHVWRKNMYPINFGEGVLKTHLPNFILFQVSVLPSA